MISACTPPPPAPYSSSRIRGLHSASTFEADGTRKPETDDDLAVTAKLARLLKDWGTPPVIIGKMMGTPERVQTLTDSDLQAWNVRIMVRSPLHRRRTPRCRRADTRWKGSASIRLRAPL